MAAAAFGPASGFLEQGIALLAEDAWSSELRLTLELHEDAAKSLLLVPDFEAMDRHIDAVLAHTTDVEDKVKVCEIRILGRQAEARVADGIVLCGVLDDAQTADRYASDPCVRACQPRSVLCEPLLSQDLGGAEAA